MNDVYLNFPVTILQNAFDDIRKVMDDIMNYAGYSYAITTDHADKSKKMKAAGEKFKIVYYHDGKCFDNGLFLYFKHSENAPKIGINKDMAFDYYKNPKTEYEIAVLLAYLALKSIIGTKPYIRTSNDFLIARMGGFVAKKDVPDPLPETLAKYATRRMLDKIKFDLQNNWNVNFYSRYVRGFYVSFDQKFTLDKLVFEAEKRRKSNMMAQNKQAIETARIKALQKLGIQN